MNALQTNSFKIQKKTRNTRAGERNYACGGCQKAYKSYPALYLHIKRKHQGIKPPNTRTQKSFTVAPEEKLPTSRPSKPSFDVDDAARNNLSLESSENDFFGFTGDYLEGICPLSIKPTIKDIVTGISVTFANIQDEYLIIIRQKVEELFTQMMEGKPQSDDFQMEYETVKETGPKEAVMRIAWFIIWLGKYVVKADFIPDICFIFSRIWKVLSQKVLNVPALDNKQIWSEVYRECQWNAPNLLYFRQKDYLMPDFVKKLCQFFGKTFA